MRIQQIVETTTAGSVATVAQPMMTQTREDTNVRGLKPVQQVMKGAKKKGPYANSILESKVTEDDLAEQDLIVIPGQGRLKRTGFVKHDLDQGEHEGETLKNSLHTIIRVATHLDKRLSTSSEFPEWVSEKIGAVKSNMVTVMNYLISSQEMQHDTDAMEGSDRQWSKKDMEKLRVATRDFDDIMASDGPEAFKQELIKKRIKTKPMAGPKGVLPEQGVAEGDMYGDAEVSWEKGGRRAPTGAFRNPNFGNVLQKSVNKHNKAIVKTRQDIGSRIADIGPGGKEHNEKTDAAWDAAKKKVSEGSQQVDSLVTDALKLMRGSEVSDAVRALTTVLGNREYNSRRGFYNFYIKQMIDMYNQQGVSEGAKVDRMVKHVKQSEKKLGHSDKEAENIAWATANKRGMLDNKNKKK